MDKLTIQDRIADDQKHQQRIDDNKKATEALTLIYECFAGGHSFDPYDIRVKTGFGPDVLQRLKNE